MTSEVHPTPQACLEAIDRIARTPDGAMFYVFLQRRLMEISIDNSDSALRADQGERRFADRLIGYMHKGIFESGGRTGHTGSTIGPDGREQPLVVPRAEPQRYAGRLTVRDRINAGARVAGYDRPDEA
jgi:hypothetical protein